MSDIELDYDYLAQQALRKVVADVLNITADLGAAPGEHHFYIEFLTDAPGVSLPDHLKTSYPERMTIVLQHQFENLNVTDEGFSVSLFFKGKQADLSIPFDAVTSFADPSVQFGLRFDTGPPDETTLRADSKEPPPKVEPLPVDEHAEIGDDKKSDSAAQESGDVVSLDAFRKK